jgi:hypothetical protein
MYDKNATGPEAVRTFLQMTILDGRWGPPQSDDEEEAIVLRGIVRSALAGDISMGNLTLRRGPCRGRRLMTPRNCSPS